MSHVAFEYMYRDAGNYKTRGRGVFGNPSGATTAALETAVRRRLIDGMWFDADAWGVPDLRDHDAWDEALDHGWHEFVGVRVVEPSDGGDAQRTDLASWLSRRPTG